MDAEPLTVTAARLAACLGVTPRRLTQLVTEGVLARSDAGFDLEASVRAYCTFLRGDEETKRERRELLRAQASATRARALRHAGATFTRDEIVERLRGPTAELLGLRVVATWHRGRLIADGRLPRPDIDILASELHSELSSLIANLRRRFESLFPPPAIVDTDAE